jgi:hypothetical protein
MSSLKEEGTGGPSRPSALLPRLSSLSIGEGYFARPEVPSSPSPQRQSSPDLPASLTLPLSRTRSSTPLSPGVPLRAGPSVSVDDDSASIRSFVPTLSAGDDLEAMLSEMLGTDAKWRIEQDDDIDVWDAQSDDESDSDLDTNDEHEDDGLSLLVCTDFRR